jgi:hypothetical protein
MTPGKLSVNPSLRPYLKEEEERGGIRRLAENDEEKRNAIG